MYKLPVVLCLALAAVTGMAQDQTGSAGVPPPPVPDSAGGEPIEPQVTIIRREEAVIEEYRINGVLYMVRVNPTSGPAYYLIDRDGDGSMESRTRGLQDPEVPQWVLFSW